MTGHDLDRAQTLADLCERAGGYCGKGLLAEVESLRAKLAAAEQERDTAKANAVAALRLLEVAVEDLLEWATMDVARPVDRVEQREDGSTFFYLSNAGLDVFRAGLRQARRTPRRRGPSDDDLRRAAEVYQAADHAPTEAVSVHFEIAHRTASLWIKRAREKGFLPAARALADDAVFTPDEPKREQS